MDPYESEAAGAWAGEQTAAPQPAEPGPVEAAVDAQVLARLPDLDTPEQGADGEAKPPRSDGRVIGQRLSTRLLVGGAVVLVLAAIIPFMLGRDRPKPGNEGLPDWHPGVPAPSAGEAPPWNARTAQAPDAPPAEPVILQSQVPPALGPQVPPALGAVPHDSDQDPPSQNQDWNTQSRTSPLRGQTRVPAAAEQISRWKDRGQTAAVDPQPLMSAWPRPSPPSVADRSRMPDVYSPPVRHDDRFEARRPASRYYRSQQEPQSTANRSMAIDEPASAARGGYHTGDRRSFQPRSLRPPQPAEPGAAWLEGTITIPGRSTYERARPGVH